MFRKKIPVGRIIPPFFSDRFFIYLHDSNSIFWAGRINSEWVSGGTVMNVLTMPLQLGHSDLPLATTLPPAGFVITLTLPCVLMAATTSARSWSDCSTLEQMHRRYLKIGVGVVFTTGFIVFLAHLTRIFVLSVILLSAFFLGTSTLFFRTSNGKPFFVCVHLVELW